jgi:D-3-phosphoglycerate dehydrogenase
MNRILVTEPGYFTSESLARMSKRGRVMAKRLSSKALLKAVADVDVLVVRVETKIDAELVRHAKKLKCVVSTTTGLDHIALAALKARGIPVFSLHGIHSVPTAEHAIALLFSTARNIPSADAHMKSGQWHRWHYIGTELAGKTLGIFGLGRIGTEVAQRARALHMNVISYDPYVSEMVMKTRGATKVGWRVFLKESDFILIHAPLTTKTRRAFDKKAFALMKPSMIIVNTARGDIINNRALISALRAHRIRGAAIDVYAKEPLPRKNPLRDYAKHSQNLILTPHIGASTREAVARASDFAATTIEKFFSS